ncbi:MAG: tRNA methyl transferase PRC-barrel domain-containing protein, partial [Minisyncoccota bacterium]
KEGDVLNMSGEVIGTHDGAALYTVGQRHGFRIAANEPVRPHYVVRIDASHNTITASDKREDTEILEARLVDLHWLQDFEMPLTTEGQSRYREQILTLVLRQNGPDKCIATFDLRHAVSKGQSLVVYRGALCLGGGRIT